jgi:meso-butanediol dehydrogenase / (S,S)-butanediol dehydrogenase / diacetyl reductase
MRLEGRTVLVTGAAGGIGAAIARGTAAEGASVVVSDIDEEGARATAAWIRDKGGRAAHVRADVTDRGQVRAAVAAAADTFGRLDVMFNNAGINVPELFLDVTEENWDRVMDVNAKGVLLGTQEAARRFVAQGGPGKIVNTASIAGRQGYPAFAAYCASKFSVIALTQAAARALAKDRITVNAFAPGVVDTPLWERLDRQLVELGESAEEGEAFAQFAASALLGRPAAPEDMVPTAVFLAASDSDFITGQVIPVDGGLVLT